jgi:hypothetical protein
MGPRGNDDHGLLVLRPPPGVQREGVATAPADGVGSPGPTQRPQGGRIPAALGRDLPAEAKHVRPLAQPQLSKTGPSAQLPAGPHELSQWTGRSRSSRSASPRR